MPRKPATLHRTLSTALFSLALTITASLPLHGCVIVIVAHPGSEVDFDIGGAFKVAPAANIGGKSNSTQSSPGSNRPD